MPFIVIKTSNCPIIRLFLMTLYPIILRYCKNPNFYWSNPNITRRGLKLDKIQDLQHCNFNSTGKKQHILFSLRILPTTGYSDSAINC